MLSRFGNLKFKDGLGNTLEDIGVYIYSLVRWFRDRKSGIIEILLGDCYRKCLRLCIGD